MGDSDGVFEVLTWHMQESATTQSHHVSVCIKEGVICLRESYFDP